MTLSTLLKRVLLLDAASCLGLGALLLIGASTLSGLLGIEAGTLRSAGAILVPCGLFMVWTAMRNQLFLVAVAAIVLGNIWWVAQSFLLLGQWPDVTEIGQAAVVVQALAVTGLAGLETMCMLRLRAERV